MNRRDFERLLRAAGTVLATRTEDVASLDGKASADGVLGGREEATLSDADGTTRVVRVTTVRVDDAGRVVSPETFAGTCLCGAILGQASARACGCCGQVLCGPCSRRLGVATYCAPCWLPAVAKRLLLGGRFEPPGSPPPGRK
ncbi:MAG: hypothetical protein L6R43_12980 [Planctomycetes bacterium]|nr:hypothetical protein [Planctomycetota bacterium]